MVHITPTGYLPAEVNGATTTTPTAPNTAVLNSPSQATKTSGDLTMATKGGQQVWIVYATNKQLKQATLCDTYTQIRYVRQLQVNAAVIDGEW